jgi:hypothetical protein
MQNFKSERILVKGDLFNLYLCGNVIKENCLVLRIIKDMYFKTDPGLVTYVFNNRIETVDFDDSRDITVSILN